MLLTSWLFGWPGRARSLAIDLPRIRHRSRPHEVRRWMAPNVETLEVRLVPTSISLSGNDLLIESVGNVSNLDLLEIRQDFTSSRFIVSDPGQALNTSIPGAIGSGTNVVQIPFASVTNAKRLVVNTFDGTDRITLSAVGGNFGLSPVIEAGGELDDEINSTAVVSVKTLNTHLRLSAQNIRLGANLTTEGGLITLNGNVLLTNNITLTTAGAAVQLNGQLDSTPGPSNYTLVTTPRSYGNAKAQAAVDVPGGYLVTIRSAAEQAVVKSVAGANAVWIGASDLDPVTDGHWKWDSGPDFGVDFWNSNSLPPGPVNGEYSNWFSGEPDDSPTPGDAAFLMGNDTVGSSTHPGGWSDGDPSVQRAYIVESPTSFGLTVNSGTANVELNGPVGNLLPLRFLNVTANRIDVLGGSVSTFKSQTFNSGVALGGPTLLRAEEVNFAGGGNSVVVLGSVLPTLTLAPIKRDAPITVGAAKDAGVASFDVTDTDIAALASGFKSILIGEPPYDQGASLVQSNGPVQSTGPVTITSSLFSSPVLIAGGSISVTGLDAVGNKVELIATNGSITDGGNTTADITAGVLYLDSATGVGASNNAIEIAADAIAARGAISGGVFLSNSRDLMIGTPSSPGGIFTDNDVISVSSSGSITVIQPIISHGGDVSLTAANGIAINGVPIDTAAGDGSGGQFTADAGLGKFAINSFTDFVDWTSATQGSFADGTLVDIVTTSLASSTAQPNAGDTRFSDGTVYLPVQASGDFVKTQFFQQGESVTFNFQKPQFGLFLHFDGVQYQGTPFPGTPLDLYSFNTPPSRVSGDFDWVANGNSIQQINGSATADLDGTVRFDGDVTSLNMTRQAGGVGTSAGTEGIVNLQLGLFRAGGIKTSNNSATIRAADVILDGFLDAGTGLVTLFPSGTNRPINLGTEAAGSFSLTDTELDRLMAGALLIGNSNSGVITISDEITRPTVTDITLTTGGNHDIRFINANGTLDSANGQVTLLLNPAGTGAITSGGSALKDIRGINVELSSGSGGLGTSGNPIITDASTLVATTNGNASAFLKEIDSVSIASLGLSAGSGVITLTGGTFRLGGSNRIHDSSKLVVEAGAKFQLNGFNEALISLMGGGSVINGSTTPATLTVNLAGNEVFGGVLGGLGTDENNFGLAKFGVGALTLSGTNTYTGDTIVNDGKLLINGSISSNVTVKTGAVVGGSGEIDSTHALVVEGGATLALGNSPARLDVGTLSLQSGSSFNVKLNGMNAGTEYDQIHVTGTGASHGLVTIGTNVTLNSVLGFTATAGNTFVIIDNDGNDAVSGTFKNLAQGALLTISGKKFHIVYDYESGDGNKNDVALILNSPPVINNQNFSINENNANGANVGTVAATDADSVVTFEITGGNTGNVFEIGLTTGQITVADATGLDFERNPSFSLTVRVTDDAGASSTATITVDLTNAAPSLPKDTNSASDLVSEAAITGDQVGIRASSADVHGGTVTFRLTDTAGGRFSIDSDTGIVRVANASLLDFESATSHLITIEASDQVEVTTQDFTIVVTNAPPSVPVDGDNAVDAISEGVMTGDSVGITAVSNDVHGGSVTFSLTDDAGGRFAIGSTTGIVTIKDVTLLNFALSTSYTIIVRASDDRDAVSSSFTINVNGAAPPMPVDLDDHANSVPEGALEGSRVGITLFSKDAQGEDVFYRLTNDAGGRFAIDPLTGVVTVKQGRLLRFADAMYTIRAVAVDALKHSSQEQLFTISVTQVLADALPLASILPARVRVVEGDSGPNFITFLVKLNKPSDKTITIDFSTRRGDDPAFKRPEGISDATPFATDQPGSLDFFHSSGKLIFDPGVTEQPLRVQIRPDDTPEPNELFFVQLQSPVNVKLAPQQSVAIAQILDDDSVPQLIVANTKVLEGDFNGQNELVFTVQLIGDLPPGTDSVTADYFIGNIAIDTAIAGDDYGIAFESKLNGEMPTFTNQLTFTNNLRTREVHVPIRGDTDPDSEAEKTVSLRLQNHDIPATLGLSRREAVGTIIDDDSATNVVVSISPAVLKTRENGRPDDKPVMFDVKLIGKPTGTVSVSYTTVNGTATAGSDFAATSGTIEFTLADILAGIVQKSIPVTVFGDTAIEPDEIFTVALSLAPGAPSEVSIDPDLASGKVVIRNDDQAILTEDGDELALGLSNELTALLGAGAKNNPALLAALRTQAAQIIATQGLTKAIVIIIDPVDFVMTDPDGRQSGYTESTGSVNQIPGTYYSGDGAVELLIVPLPPDGTYNVQLAGLGGDFNASITVVDSNGKSTNIVSQNLSEGATSSISFQVGNTATTIPVGLGQAAANSVATAIGVVGAFGNLDFRLAFARALNEATSDDVKFDEPDSPTTGLIYWLMISAQVARQQIFGPLWQSLESPVGELLGEAKLPRIAIPSEFVDQFWSQVGQTLTGVPSGIYRLGNMLESVIPTLLPRRIRSTTPRAGEQSQPNTPPVNNGVKSKRSSLERPRSTPNTPPSSEGQAPRPNKPNAAKDKSAQTPDSKKSDEQQVNSSHSYWPWFASKDQRAATTSADRRRA